LEMMVHVVEEEGPHEDWRMVSIDVLVVGVEIAGDIG